MKKTLFSLVSVGVLVLMSVDAHALDKKKAAYLGGTLPIQLSEKEQKEGIVGLITTTDEKEFFFKAEQSDVRISIPYNKITNVEYGQKASHRVKTAILLSPVALFMKKRRHYLNFFFKDAEGKDQAAAIEVGSEILRNTVMVLEVRTGKKITYQDEESQKSFGK